MNAPIQPAAPINNVITIQPVTTAVPNRDTGAAQNPLANLASGTIIEGFVVNRDAQNNPILRTAIGDLRITSDVFLKTGSEVIFKVDQSQASLARIVSVDGMTLQDYDAQNTHGITKDTVTTSLLQTNQTQAANPSKPGAAAMPVLQALILQGQQDAAPNTMMALRAAQLQPMPLLAQLAQLRAGTPVRLNVLDLKLPPLPIALGALPDDPKLDRLMPQRPSAQPATQPAPPAAGTIATGKLADAPAQQTVAPKPQAPVEAAPAPIQQSATAPKTQAPVEAAYAPIQQPVTAEDETAILKTILQSQPTIAAHRTVNESADAMLLKSELMAQYAKSAAASVAHYAAPQQKTPDKPAQPTANPPQMTIPLQATVIGHEADGANIIHTSFATLKLYTPQPLPTGTILTVQASVEEAPAQPLPGQVAVSEEQPIDATTKRTWESLDDAMRWLQQTNPEIAQEVAQRLPKMNHTLSSGLLFFISALKQGDVGELLGKRATRLLEASAPQLLAKLRRDVMQLQTNLIDSPLMNWSIAQLPMLLGQEIQHAQLYVSKEPPNKDGEQAQKERGQRFILEIGMSQLGAMQLDGFVRQGENSKSFDLIVRSNQPLDAQVTQGISSIFQNSMEVTGMRGQVVFQTGSQHFFKPAAEPKSGPTAGEPNTILA